MESRIHDRDQFFKVNDFCGLLDDGKKSATDIDMLIEYENKLFIIGEGKHVNSKHKYGQTLALERLCDDISRSKPCLLIFYEHDTVGDIIVRDCIVAEYRWKGKWHKPKEIMVVKEIIEQFIKKYAQEN
jgi:hypothetical protein